MQLSVRHPSAVCLKVLDQPVHFPTQEPQRHIRAVPSMVLYARSAPALQFQVRTLGLPKNAWLPHSANATVQGFWEEILRVMDDSKVFCSRASAGTMSPSLKRITSPVTSSLAFGVATFRRGERIGARSALAKSTSAVAIYHEPIF